MYYCGWDGGGTKTEVCILDASGAPVAKASFGPLNPNGTVLGNVRQTALESIAFMAAQPGGLDACGGLVVGIAGVSNATAAKLVNDAVREGGYAGNLRLMGDQEIALAGAIQGPGAVLIAGTGAICFGRDAAGNRFRVGGYGYLIDDGGSGYAIGRDILAAIVRSADGRGPSTCLSEMVFEALGAAEVGDVITWLYAPTTGKKEIASLAPLLNRALAQEDAAALTIANRAADDLAELVCTAWRKTGMRGGELALMGSILQRYPPIRERVVQLCQSAFPKLTIRSPRGSASQGAARLAMEIFS